MANILDDGMKKFKKFLNSVCLPAQIYLLFSLLSYFVIVMQNLMDPRFFKCGPLSLRCPFSKIFLLVFHLVFILVFSHILNLFCKGGYGLVSWMIVVFLILFPIVMMVGGLMMLR